MTSFIFFFIFIPLLSVILLSINFILAPHKPYKEKKTPFECGYHSFLAQNRTPFNISFLVFGLLFLVFDLEIVLIYPFTVSSITNSTHGLIIMLIFAIIVTIGFVYEIGKGALKIYSKQDDFFLNTQATKDKYLLVNKGLKSGYVDCLLTVLKFVGRWGTTLYLTFTMKVPYKNLNYWWLPPHVDPSCSWLPCLYYLGLFILAALCYTASSFLFRGRPRLRGYIFVAIANIFLYIFCCHPELLEPITKSWEYITYNYIKAESIKDIKIISSIIFIFSSLLGISYLYMEGTIDDFNIFNTKREPSNILPMVNPNNTNNSQPYGQGSSGGNPIDTRDYEEFNNLPNRQECRHPEMHEVKDIYSTEENIEYNRMLDETTEARTDKEKNSILRKKLWDTPERSLPGLYTADWGIDQDDRDKDPYNMEKACDKAEFMNRVHNKKYINKRDLGDNTLSVMRWYLLNLYANDLMYEPRANLRGVPTTSLVNTKTNLNHIRNCYRSGVSPMSQNSFIDQTNNPNLRPLPNSSYIDSNNNNSNSNNTNNN